MCKGAMFNADLPLSDVLLLTFAIKSHDVTV